MNKIYKVIWSKVKNQYVVVSELAHSNGKQSRTSRNSIRSRIAALVVCGAIAAFGVFSAVPNSAYAVAGGVATQSQYIAIATDSNSDDTANYDGYNYYKKSVSINGQTKYYYVREGYDISVVYGKRYAGADNSSAYIIDAKKNDQYNQSSDQGLLQAYQTTTSKGQITTLTGVNIEDLNTGVYGGASNAGGVDTPSDFGYHIKVNNLDGVFTVDDDGYIKVSNDLDGRGDWTIDAGVPGNTNFETYFSDKVTLENDGTYSYTHGNEKVTVPTNKVYSIGGKLGVFTDAKGNLYTGDVYGDNNEILLSAVGEGNQIYSYWGTKVNDPTQTIGNMTVQDYNSDRKKLQDQAAAYHGDDITNIAVGGANNKGTISLNRVGIYDEQTGGYTSTTPVPGTITVTSTGGTGGSGVEHDVKIKFSNTDEQGTEHSFTVDAGSKVVANNGAGGTDLETISVNGQTFNVIGGAISGQIDSKGNVKIQQGNKAPVTIGKVSDWNVKSGQINGSTLTLTTENAYDGDPKTKTVTIEGVASTNYVDGKDALNVKYNSTDKTSITLGKDGNKTQIHNVAAGTDDYDAVNFKQLQDVAGAEDYVKEGTINTSTGVIKLTRQLGGEITINGLQDYVNGKDSYVTDAKLNGNTLTITQNNQGKPFNIDLSGLTSGLSSSDYQLVAPESGSYTVDNNGNLTLTVKDLNNKNAATKTITISGLAKKTDVAVIHDQYKDGEYTNLRDTKAQIWDETAGASDKKSSSIALGKDAFVSVQNGNKANAVLFDSDTYTGGIAIGQDSKALNGTVNIGVKDYTGKMGDVIVGDPNNRDLDNGEYNTYTAMGVGETSVGSNSYISGSLSTNIGSYNVITTKYGDYEKTGNGFMDAILAGLNKPYAAQNTGSIVVGTLNSIESNSSTDVTSGVANSVVGMANKTQNSNGSLVFGTGNEITNSIDSIPSPVELSDIISGKKNDKDVTEVANSFRDSVSDRDNKNGGAVLAIGGGNKADYALNSQLIGVQNQITGTKDAASQYNMVNGYQNTVENGSNDTVIGVKNTVTNGDSNIVLGDNHTVQNADNNVILGSSDKVATQTASDTVVIGHNAQANGNNDVAIGSGSIANGAVGTEGYAGANPIGTVSVGSEGNERTITNVAAGRINEDSTDAVNGSQLASVKDGAVKYWQNEDGSYDKSFVQLEGGEDGTLVTHVRDGAVNEYSSDAVNGSQLWETQQQIEEAQTEAGKHTTIQETGKNINVTKTETDGQLDYTINLNDDITLGNYTKGTGVVVSGSSGTISATNAISVGVDPNNEQKGIVISSGKSDSIVGLDNIEWKNDADWQKDNIQADRAATEGQLQQATSTLTTNERHIATNGGDNPEAPNNKYTVQANGTVSLTEVNGDGTPTKNTVVLDNVATKTQQDINTDKLTHIEHYAVDDEGNTEGKDYTQVEGTKLYNDGSISSTVKDGWGMSSDTLTFDESGLTVSKETMGNGSGSTNISGDTIKTVDEYGNETTIDGGSVTTEDLTVNTENGNKLTFDSTGLNVNSGDTGLSVNKDGISLSVDNGAGKNSSVKVTQDGTEFSYSENGIADATTTTIKGSTITTDTVTGLNNTTWDDELAKQVANSEELQGTAATQGQLQQAVSEVAEVANAGWTASDGTNSISVKPNETLTFVGDENLTVSADGTDKKLKVSLNDNITLGDGQSAITLNGSPQNSDDPALSVGTDKFVVAQDGSLSVSDKFNVDAETGNIYAANNSGSAIMMNDDSVALNAGGNGIVASDEGILLNTNGIDEDIKLVTKGTSVSVDNDGATFTNTNTNETTNIDGGTINVGDRLMVEEDGSIYATNNNGSTVMINDNGVALNSEGNGVVVSGEGITLNTNGSAVTVDRFNGATFTNTNTGETTNINGDIITTDTVKGLSNTTWDDELATQVANSEELQGTAATQGQLQQAVSAVATEAAKQHTTVSGDDNLTVKSSVNENGGTNYQVTLDDDITLGNPKAGNTEGERSFTINTTAPEGYVPDSYKEENSSGAEFIKENGGFMLFATDTQGHGIFGVTAKGSAWAKDFKTYTTDIYGNNTQYSLNDVGDAVAQMSSYYNKENGKSYTVFSRYLNEAEKDNPFATVDENATRDIPLALRDDGAVLIGATIKGDDFTDNGIRINAETETTYDGDGNEVTNNIATITGLENTEWKPPTPVATLAANDGSATVTSRAATESQLNDLYSAVAAYDVNVDGTIDYSHIALAGAPYGASRAGNGTPTGGTSITNVAYASGKDGSEAVNVDYLNDAISDAAENGSISTSDQHLVANTETGSNGVYKPNDDGNVNLIVSDEKGNSSTITIGDVASKEDLDNLKDDVGDLDYSKVEGDTIIDGDSVTDAIGKLDNKIENISGTATDADNNTVTGGKINSDGTISLTQKDKDSIKLEGQLTDSGVVQEGTSFDKETGTITITSQDKYSGETSSVKVEGIASTEVVGATNKEDLATAYKDADKDGNATTEYITDSESMVEADVALDHAIQDVANTSYANDMVLSNRIDSVEKRLGNVEERIDKVGAMAAAIANLRTMGFDPEAPTEIAIGVGQYKSETGIAIGVFHYPNQDFMLSASLSSSGDELMGGIGATWKLGRKSAAERAKDEEARHLEQAEEMKKLAQQEKVKAQAQRHAKLLAERQQASQKNA
mgnify:CR=1 FL=1